MKNIETNNSATYSTTTREDATIKDYYATMKLSNEHFEAAIQQHARSLPKATKKPGAPGLS